MKVAFLTLGCKVNSYETEAIWELMEKAGYERVEFESLSDVYIINTCSVTNNGEAKSRKMIRHAIQTNPKSIVVVMGCFSQLKAEEVMAIEGVSIAVGTNHREQIPQLIEQFLLNRQSINNVEALSSNEGYDGLSINHLEKHQRAFLKIQDGCNNFCSYCIIPYARGRVRSKAPQQVISEAKTLIERGYQEIILTGIHTGGYGLDLKDYRFADLLSELVELKGLKRLRISSIEITELTADVMEVIKNSTVIVNHLHVPLQSGSERILKLMNRKYTKAEYFDKIKELREIKPNLSITTDIIVGFPSETEEDFQEILDFVQLVHFQELHVFPFSKRDGTLAANMDGQVDGLIKKDRVNRLISLSEKLVLDYATQNVGMTLSVIPESYENGYLIGHSENYLLLRFKGNKESKGTIVPVVLTKPGFPHSEGIKA